MALSKKIRSQQEFGFVSAAGQSLTEQLALLRSAPQRGVARSPAEAQEQETLDYCYMLLCDNAPRIWNSLCPRCKALLEGLEQPSIER